MRKKETLSLLVAALTLVIAFVAVAGASPSPELARSDRAPQLAEADNSTIMYTVIEGSHEDAVRAFHGLIQMRDDLGIAAAGDWGTFVYLSVPDATTNDQTIEVQIPVESDGLKADEQAKNSASLYQLGTSGVKAVAAKSVVRVTKPVGVGDPTSLYQDLYRYIERNNLKVNGSAYEQFAQVEAIPDTCSADELETTISVPVS